jgi:hypothetical protein
MEKYNKKFRKKFYNHNRKKHKGNKKIYKDFCYIERQKSKQKYLDVEKLAREIK